MIIYHNWVRYIPALEFRNTVVLSKIINQYNTLYYNEEKKLHGHSIDTEKAFDKIGYLFLIKTLRNVGRDRNFLKQIKGIYEKPTANIMPDKDLLPLLFNTVFEALARAISHKNRNKMHSEKTFVTLD